MNTDGDYLWDKTGEPDPEVQQLEEILGTLRYQPRPLEIPAGLQVGRERSFFRSYGSRLAIAATIAMLLLGLGVWLGLQRLRSRQPTSVAQAPRSPTSPVVNNNPTPAPLPTANDNQNPAVATTSPGAADHKRTDLPRRHRVNQSALAANLNRPRKAAVKNPQLAANELDGEAAKNQLMLALRLASAKLAFAQKKTQSTNPRDLIHNQHKIG